MPKIPRSPEEIFDEFSADVTGVFGKDVISIILYGSGARGDYVYKKSDINFLVVLTAVGMQQLHKSFDLVQKWRGRGVSLPLFLDQDYILSSLDSYPIEFLNMQKHHRVVYGEDVLQPLKIARQNLRLQCEALAKGKLLHLREAFLRTGGAKKGLEQMLSVTVPTFASLFNALLTFKRIDAPKSTADAFVFGAEKFGLDVAVFRKIVHVREKREKLTAADLMDLTQKYIQEIRNLAINLDKM